MSGGDNFSEDSDNKRKAVSAFENDRSDQPEPDSSSDITHDSFLESVAKLAIGQKSNFPDSLAVRNTDLPNVSIDDYSEIDATDKTARKEALQAALDAMKKAKKDALQVYKDSKKQNLEELTTAQLTCVQTSIDKRDTAMIAAVDAFNTATKSALATRLSALKAAWSISTAKERRVAINTAWITYNTALKTARTTFNSAKLSAWQTYQQEAKTCTGNPSANIYMEYEDWRDSNADYRL